MAVIMEVIEKSTDFSTGSVTLKILDTDFSQLAKYIGSDPGKEWRDFTTNDVVSVEGLQSLNDEQLTEYVPKFNEFIEKYNEWVDLANEKVENLNNFEYNFTALTSWAYSYIAGSTVASYSVVLTDIAASEKEMYDFCYFSSDDHMNENLEILKEWSKTQNYTSCVDTYISREFETRYTRTDWDNYNSSVSGVTVTGTTSRGDKNRLIVSGLENIILGNECTISVRASYEESDGGDIISYTAIGYWIIKREELGISIDDGYIITDDNYWTGSSTLYQRINGEPYVDEYTGDYSPHFDGTATLPFLATRVLI